MNDVTTRPGTAVANPNTNYFTSYGDQAAQRTIIGKLLKFSKGDYLAGEDNEDVPIGTRFIALMDEFLIGWIRWADNKPTDHVMGRLSEGYQPPRRNELGDLDETKWEIDEASKEPRDPWQFSNYLLLKHVDEDNSELPGDGDDATANVYTLTVSSKGGISALGLLVKKYGKALRQRPDQWPVIELEVDSYQHKNKAYGRIKVPVFNLVGWVPKDRFTLDADAEPALPLEGGSAAARI